MLKSKKIYFALAINLTFSLAAADFQQRNSTDIQGKIERIFSFEKQENAPVNQIKAPFYLQKPESNFSEKQGKNQGTQLQEKINKEDEDFPLRIQEIPSTPEKITPPSEEITPQEPEQKKQAPNLEDEATVKEKQSPLQRMHSPNATIPSSSLKEQKLKEIQQPIKKNSSDSQPTNETEVFENKKLETTPEAAEKEQQETEEDELRLKPTGTWTEQKAHLYRMPSTAIKGIKGNNAPYTLWIDPYEWEETDSLNIHADRSFESASGTAYAIIVAQKKTMSLNDLNDIVIKNASQSGFEKVVIIEEEKRLVNGQEVLFLHWQAHINGNPIDFLSYLYTKDNWVILLHTYTHQDTLQKNQQAMEHFLDGISPNQ